jgi:uncharacterized OB-fold protein
VPTSAAAPRPTPLTQPFWDGCARGELTLQRCRACRLHVHFPRTSCPGCGSTDLDWQPVDPHGTLATFTEVHRTFAPGFEDDVPYVVGVAELAIQRGLRIVANVPGDAAGLRLGLAVRVEFADRAGFGADPVLRPVCERLYPRFR